MRVEEAKKLIEAGYEFISDYDLEDYTDEELLEECDNLIEDYSISKVETYRGKEIISSIEAYNDGVTSDELMINDVVVYAYYYEDPPDDSSVITVDKGLQRAKKIIDAVLDDNFKGGKK